ncbi:DUF2268 domain-containing putative Zn-dependent protease [Emticicia sp. C21]|uniref:DUF2268 domain-containing putative Zn-dependent protease n=1 Tax=Emticicia sp. C21 TaxID=2302915 RepID=UPI00131410E3|nr:DUF2268 domain-containing putative Zn-dependent protease [Emticicia sp. C21]
MKKTLLALLVFYSSFTFAQTTQFNHPYENVSIAKGADLLLKLKFEKGAMYQFLVLQQGIDVMLTLSDETNKVILEKDSPNGRYGFEIAEYLSKETKEYTLTIKKLEEDSNVDKGIISYYIKKYSKAEQALKEKTRQGLAIENNKNVLTADIDHFWEAVDNLKNCKTRWDSVLSFQNLYLDRATNGLIDFIRVRNFSADEFVRTIARYPKYYQSVRPYTYESKKAEPLIEEVFAKLKSIYGNFKPFKVCFAIGVHRTGGTVSDRYVLLGTEMITTGKNVDYSELGGNWAPKDSTKEPDIPLRIKGMIAHECVHTQQKDKLNEKAVVCNQLYNCLREGIANFIGELITGETNYSVVNEYGDKHENELWTEFKSTLCAPNVLKWLYNGATVKDRPADLGYYMGYRIAKAYYNNSSDKAQAIKDIIDMDDPLNFLQKSGYDQQKKN